MEASRFLILLEGNEGQIERVIMNHIHGLANPLMLSKRRELLLSKHMDENIFAFIRCRSLFLAHLQPCGLFHPRHPSVSTYETTRERLGEYLRNVILETFIKTLSGYLDRKVLTTTLHEDTRVFLRVSC
jgi:hypothetical protein